MGYDAMIEILDAQQGILDGDESRGSDGSALFSLLEGHRVRLTEEIDYLSRQLGAPDAGPSASDHEVPEYHVPEEGHAPDSPADTTRRDGDEAGGPIAEAAPPAEGDIPAEGGGGLPPRGDEGDSTADIPYSRQTLRVETERIDTIMNLVGELVVNRASFSQLVGAFREMYRELLDLNRLNKREMALLRQLALSFESSTMELGRVSNDLQEGVMRVRMVGINQLFSRFPRLVRDLADKMDKDVKLVINGKETELDKSVIEEIGDPLIHIIRNSIDHGIETREERKKKKKTEGGTLSISAYHQGNQVIIDVTDDGRGIDLEEVKKRLVKDGEAVPDEVARISEREAVNYLFRPGISLARKVSDVSGRGVGLDIVKKNIEKLKGTVEVVTQKDVGTSFIIKLPLTLAIIQALVVEISQRVYSIPLGSITETVRAGVGEVETIEGHQVLRLRDKVLPLLRLKEVFHADSGKLEEKDIPRDRLYVVILSAEGREAGLVVDRLIGEDNIVIRSLEKYLSKTKGISGASIMGDGTISLILDVAELVNLAIEREKALRKKQALERNTVKRKEPKDQPNRQA
jgi:two-component system chemotaxis sensor kinase CheA